MSSLRFYVFYLLIVSDNSELKMYSTEVNWCNFIIKEPQLYYYTLNMQFSPKWNKVVLHVSLRCMLYLSLNIRASVAKHWKDLPYDPIQKIAFTIFIIFELQYILSGHWTVLFFYKLREYWQYKTVKTRRHQSPVRCCST